MPAVRKALRALVDQVDVASVADRVGAMFAKDAVSDQMVAEAMSLLPDTLDVADLDAALRKLIVDGYLAGEHAAGEQVAPHVVSVEPGQAAAVTVDWDTWTPGHPPAAAFTADGALGNALDNLGITLDGISRTALDEIGNRIAAGITAGTPSHQIGRDTADLVGSDSRAEMIAHTETARAMTSATMAVYGVNGITQWDLITSAGACAVCMAVEAANPHSVADSGGLPPIHPRCRCSSAPHIN